MWSKSPATIEELVTHGMSRCDGTFRDVLTNSASLPLPSHPCTTVCTSGGKMMPNSGVKCKLFSKRSAARVNAVSW